MKTTHISPTAEGTRHQTIQEAKIGNEEEVVGKPTNRDLEAQLILPTIGEATEAMKDHLLRKPQGTPQEERDKLHNVISGNP